MQLKSSYMAKYQVVTKLLNDTYYNNYIASIYYQGNKIHVVEAQTAWGLNILVKRRIKEHYKLQKKYAQNN